MSEDDWVPERDFEGVPEQVVEIIMAHVKLGAHVLGALILDNEIRLRVEGGELVLWDGGQDCCERRWISTDDDLNSLKDGALYAMKYREVEDQGRDDGNIHDKGFLIVETSAGSVTFVTHNEHNGYYGGFSLHAKWVEGAP